MYLHELFPGYVENLYDSFGTQSVIMHSLIFGSWIRHISALEKVAAGGLDRDL
jgi:hypothetical protein